MTYFNAQDIKTAEKFFGHRIYIDFGDKKKENKYSDECTYDELKDYVFCEFISGEDVDGTPEITVEVRTEESLYDEYTYDEDGVVYECVFDYEYDRYCEGNIVYDPQQAEITFEDIVCDMIIPYYFNIDTANKKITVA